MNPDKILGPWKPSLYVNDKVYVWKRYSFIRECYSTISKNGFLSYEAQLVFTDRNTFCFPVRECQILLDLYKLSTLNGAKKKVDKILIARGFKLLTQEQYDNYKLLL